MLAYYRALETLLHHAVRRLAKNCVFSQAKMYLDCNMYISSWFGLLGKKIDVHF